MDQDRSKRNEKQVLAALNLERKSQAESPVSNLPMAAISVDKVVDFPLQIPNMSNGPCSCHTEEKKCQNAFSAEACNKNHGSHEHDGMEVEENGNEAAISFIDEDDDQGSIFTSTQTGNHEQAFRNFVEPEGGEPNHKPSSQRSPGSFDFKNFMTTYNGSGVSAEIDDTLLMHSDGTMEKLEFAETHQQQQRVPPPTLYGNLSLNGVTDGNDGHQQRSRSNHRRVFDEFETPDQEMQELGKSTGEKVFTTRAGKTIRRKPREDKSIMRSEEIAGYYGDKDVDDILKFIQGEDAVDDSFKKAREEHGKRAKKKSGGSADHGNPVQNKKAQSPDCLDPEAPGITDTKEEKMIAAPTPNGESEAGGINAGAPSYKQSETCNPMEPSTGAASAKGLKLEKLALKTFDLPSPMQSTAADERAKFFPVVNRKQKQGRYDRVFRGSKYKRATTPPPPTASQKGIATASSQVGRQRRNSYDYSFGTFNNTVATITSVKEASIVSSTSSCSFRAKTCIGATSEVTFVSHAVVDNADSKINDTSFSSVDGDMAAAVKMSYANVAGAISASRQNQESVKGGPKIAEIQDNPSRKEPNSCPKASDAAQPINAATVLPAIDQATVDVKSTVEFPSLSSVSNVEILRGEAILDGEKGSRSDVVVSLTPVKMDLSLPSDEFKASDFMYVSSTGTSELADKTEVPPIQSSSSLTGNGQEVLQMLFDSCKNDALGVVRRNSNVSGSCVSIQSDDNIGPAVQFMGIPAPLSDSAYNISFIFGETEDDNAIKEVMTRSNSMMAQLGKTDRMATSTKSLDTACDMKKRRNEGTRAGFHRPLESPSDVDGRPQRNKAYNEMIAFVNEAWQEFTRDGNFVYYDPEIHDKK